VIFVALADSLGCGIPARISFSLIIARLCAIFDYVSLGAATGLAPTSESAGIVCQWADIYSLSCAPVVELVDAPDSKGILLRRSINNVHILQLVIIMVTPYTFLTHSCASQRGIS
jgi:hypothetical protein